jgi:Tol biopolymer transport system component
VASPGRYSEPYLLFDDRRMVIDVRDFSGIADIGTLDLLGGSVSRLTFNPADDTTALWSPDGERIVWGSSRAGGYNLYQKAANGTGNDELLLKSPHPKYPDDWSADGRFILYDDVDPKTQFDLWTLPTAGDRQPKPFLITPANESHGRFSPDGKWVAYESDESGRAEIYVQSFPTGGGKWQVSSGGGGQPLWRRDGKELFYVAADGRLTAVAVKTAGPAFQAGERIKLSVRVPTTSITGDRNTWVATADGQKFLVTRSVEDERPVPITVVLDWPALLKK